MANPPIWIYRQTILPYGARLQKAKPKWEEPKRESRGHSSTFLVQNNTSAIWRASNGKYYKYDFNLQKQVEVPGPSLQIIGKTAYPGNLSNSEYFKWVGKRQAELKLATCRACGFVAADEQQRRSHDGCGKICQNAWILLKSDKTEDHLYKCAICNQGTTQTPWGVPLCLGCTETWKFGLPVTGEVPGMMKFAVDFAKNDMGLK